MTIIIHTRGFSLDVAIDYNDVYYLRALGRRWHDGSWSVLCGRYLTTLDYRLLFNFGEE